MRYWMPVTVFAEADCVKNHAEALAALGEKALIVTGRSAARRSGALADVEAALRSQGRDFALYDRVEENPSVETVMDARESGLRAGADFVIGIGGGSAMDAAKAAAIMMRRNVQGAEYLYAPAEKQDGLPVATIPTTCGTGSEVTPNAVLTIPARKAKGSSSQRLFPQLALIDVKYLHAAPPALIRGTALDAFAHLIESGLNTNATDYSRVFVEGGLRLWGRSCAALRKDGLPQDDDLWNLMNAATLAGMAIAHTGTSLPHALGYGVTCHLHIPHGRASAYFLPGYLREAGAALNEPLLRLAGFADTAEFTAFYHACCGEETVPPELLRSLTEELLRYDAKLRACPYPATREVIYRICGLE